MITCFRQSEPSVQCWRYRSVSSLYSQKAFILITNFRFGETSIFILEKFQLYITGFQLLWNTLQLNKTAFSKNTSLTDQFSVLLRTRRRFIACMTLRNFPKPPKHLVSQFRKKQQHKLHIFIAIRKWTEKLIPDGFIFEIYPLRKDLTYISVCLDVTQKKLLQTDLEWHEGE